MAAIRNPHDAFFRASLARLDLARDFLSLYLPAEVSAGLDFDGLEPLRDSFVDEELADHFSDLLFAVPTHDGDRVQIAVLLEHKSYPEPQVALQLLRYMVRIWEQASKNGEPLLPVLPVVFYHGNARWQIEQELHELIPPPAWMAPFVPQFRYWLCDLSRFDDDQLRGEAALRAMLLTFKYIKRDELRVRVREIALLLEQIAKEAGGPDFCRQLLRYLVTGTGKLTERELQSAVTSAWEAGGQFMETIAQGWLDQGMQQGLQQGVQQGLDQGMQQGLQQGVQQGLQQGVQQGLQQGVQQGLQSGRRQELLAGIELALELRYGAAGLKLMPEIEQLQSLESLTAVRDGIRTAATPDELREIYA